MRVGTLTYHQSNNYGAVLQAYALQKHLIEHGAETEIINYYPNSKSIEIQHSIISKVKKYLTNPVPTIEKRKKQRKFNQFRNTYLNIASTTFRGDKQIADNPPDYDLYIVGSDQVWNTDISNKSKAYFLNFVKSGYRISYAASLGKDYFNQIGTEYAKKYLANFDGISVREKLLKQNLESEFRLNSEHVLDPVFLLNKESWKKISSRIRLPKAYVLCYMMEYSLDLINKTKDVARKLGCTPIFISPSHTNFSGKKLKGFGPDEFIYAFINARYICTNSFHGTAFSVILQKDFTAVRHSKLNSRISSLIEILGLDERFLDSNNSSLDKINYNEVEYKLNSLIDDSKKFLNNYINMK